jgi:hypothetical protein
MSFFIDKDPKIYLPQMGYQPLFKDKWVKSVVPKVQYPRFHIYGYGPDFHRGHKLRIHIDVKKHVSFTNRDTQQKIDKEIKRLTSNNFDVDRHIKLLKKEENEKKSKETIMRNKERARLFNTSRILSRDIKLFPLTRKRWYHLLS